jgi:hypothetical protein
MLPAGGAEVDMVSRPLKEDFQQPLSYVPQVGSPLAE